MHPYAETKSLSAAITLGFVPPGSIGDRACWASAVRQCRRRRDAGARGSAGPSSSDELFGQDIGGTWGVERGGIPIKQLYDIYAHGVADEEVYGRRATAPFCYGSTYGPCAGHTWAAEGVLLASLRQVLGRNDRSILASSPAGVPESTQAQTARSERPRGIRKEAESNRKATQHCADFYETDLFWRDITESSAPENPPHAEVVVASGSIRARPALRVNEGLSLCCRVAQCLLRVVRVVYTSDAGRRTCQGLVTQVVSAHGLSLQENSFSLLTADGLMVCVPVSSVEELVILTLAGM